MKKKNNVIEALEELRIEFYKNRGHKNIVTENENKQNKTSNS